MSVGRGTGHLDAQKRVQSYSKGYREHNLPPVLEKVNEKTGRKQNWVERVSCYTVFAGALLASIG